MYSDIPLEVLGLLGPLLSWVETPQSNSMPRDWQESNGGGAFPFSGLDPDEVSASFQERGWLLQELPTYSLDTLDEVVSFARRKDASRPFHGRWRPPRCRVGPPPRFDLFRVFEKLTQRYLVWNGGEVTIKEGRMVELHELGFKIPLSFLTRHAHARAVAAGEKGLDEVVNLPESVTLLPSNAHGMRIVIRRGLTEGHLHMNSIHAAEIAWADHLLKPLRHKPKNFGSLEWRLLKLSRAAARTLALATTLCKVKCDPLAEQAQRVLDFFDLMYFAREFHTMDHYGKEEEKALGDVISKAMQTKLTPNVLFEADQWPRKRRTETRRQVLKGVKWPDANLGLLHWLGPWGLIHKAGWGPFSSSYGALQNAIDREGCLSSLHLAAHLELVKARFLNSESNLSENTDSRAADDRNQTRFYKTTSGRFLHQAFFRYLICQTHYWQLAVQQGRTTGLRRFKSFFDSHQRRPIMQTSQEKADSVLQRVREWRGLRALEGRVAPPEKSGLDFIPWLNAFAKDIRPLRVEKMGLVVHFIKDDVREINGASSRRPRFAVLRAMYRRQAFRLFRILEQPSLVTPFIVGIDAANLELATPPEVFAPVFRYLRDQPIALREPDTVPLNVRMCGGPIRDLVGQRRLGMTYHVGEEFRHLLSGLRAIDEVLEFLAPAPGDRLGHAIALGLDPKKWLHQVGFQTLVSKQEWLDTLVWLYHFLGPSDELLGKLGVETTIVRLGREIYASKSNKFKLDKSDGKLRAPTTVTPFSLQDVWRLRQLDPEFLVLGDEDDVIKFQPIAGGDTASWRWNRIMKHVVKKEKERVGINPPYDLLAKYWYDDDARQAGERLELVNMEVHSEVWKEICLGAQAKLQDKVSRGQIGVEVNPSSNRVIGPIGSFSDHHIFNLTHDKKGKRKRHIRVTVNTDNPGTANTSLAHEYYLLGETLLSKNVSEPEVVAWLEWLRQNGEESSFIRYLPKADDPRMIKIIQCLKSQPSSLRDISDPDQCLNELWKRWPKWDDSRKSRSQLHEDDSF